MTDHIPPGVAQVVLGAGEDTAAPQIENAAYHPKRWPTTSKDRRGTIAMARRPNERTDATCQFFINITDNEALNFKTRIPRATAILSSEK